MIQALPEDVRCRLRSGIAITSVGQCVEELLLNSIDALATCIAVRIDLEILKVQVVDNGCGLGPDDMERVGIRYFTSKCHSMKDLENLKCYGFRGEAIASIADVCSIVEVTSRPRDASRTFTKLFQGGKTLPAQQAEVTRPSPGTTVSLYNLFYNLPVRRKCMDPVLELERVRHKIEAVSLMKPHISISLKNDTVHSMILQLPKTRDVCSRFCQIYGLSKAQSLREIQHAEGQIAITGFISCEGYYNRTMQFLYVNSRLVLKTRLHKLIDFMLKKESVICRQKAGRTSSSPGTHRPGSELHGIFVLDIQCPFHEYDICLQPDKTLIEFQDWNAVVRCVELALRNFLKKENLFLEPSKEDVNEFNQRHNLSLSCDEFLVGVKLEQVASRNIDLSSIEYSDPVSLRSKSVFRSTIISAQNSAACGEAERDSSGVTRDIMPSYSPQADSTKRSDCPSVCSNVTPCQEAEGQHQNWKEISDHKDNLQNDSPAGVPFVPVTTSLENYHSANLNCLSSKSFNVGSEATAGTSAWIIPRSYSGPTNQSNIFSSLTTTDSIEKTMTQETKPDGAVHYSTKASTSNLANMMPEVSEKTRPLKLHLPYKMGSLDRFRRLYGRHKTLDHVGLLQVRAPEATELETSETSFIVQSETRMHNQTVMDRACGMTQSDHGTANETPARKCHSTLASKLCMLRRNKELVSCPVEIQSGELQVKVVSDRSMIELCQITVAPIGSYYDKSKNTDTALPASKPALALNTTAPSTVNQKDKNQSMDNCCSSSEPAAVPQFTEPFTGTLENENQHMDNRCSASEPAAVPQITGSIAVPWGDENQTMDNDCSFSELAEVPQITEPTTGPREDKQQNMDNGCSCSTIRPAAVPQIMEPINGLQEDENQAMDNSCSASEPDTAPQITEPTTGSQEDANQTTIGRFLVSEPVSVLQITQPSTGSLEDNNKTMVSETDMDNSLSDCGPEITALESQVKHEEGHSGDVETQNSCIDWLKHYEQTLGRNVFINPHTGFSAYSVPAEDLTAACTSDLSTMSVNVVCSNGFQYQCHPFRSDLLMSFLPKSSAERNPTLQTGDGSLERLYSGWRNEVFPRHPSMGLDISAGCSDPLIVKIHNVLYPYRFTKEMVHTMQVLQQIDNKFIACMIDTKTGQMTESNNRPEFSGGNLVVLVDQHAAHERVRLEQLIADSYEVSPLDGRRKLKVSTVNPPLELDITQEQHRLLRTRVAALHKDGLSVSFSEGSNPQVLVSEIPICFVDKRPKESNHRRATIAKKLVEEFLQEEMQLLQSSGVAHGILPGTVLKALASQACHGAVKFGDPLSVEECCHLVRSLARCALPFQCAHGRPSILPLVDLLHLLPQEEITPKPNLQRLRPRYDAWRQEEQQQPITAQSQAQPVCK
ncbi:DNA mismatch repair protein Mlh3 isoform X2 [Hyperolius riggenbachi]|uniref:DNA mismatch repair protein Mlh3 isoform X2 n=1 Tax=Hyperolius riggenbachi TaxID=752182 RepID=UPI0035A2C135